MTPMLRSAYVTPFSTREGEGDPSRRSFRSALPCLAPPVPTRICLGAILGLEMGILSKKSQNLKSAEWRRDTR
jgi:hypothetical protein